MFSKESFGASLAGAAVALAVAVSASPASASVMIYTDYASWSTAVTGIGLSTLPDPGSFTYLGTGTTSTTYDGVNYSTTSDISDSNVYLIGPAFSGATETVFSSQQESYGLPNIKLTFAHGVTAVAFNFATFNGGDLSFLTSGGDSVSGIASSNAGGYNLVDFLGFTTDAPIDSVQFVAVGSGEALSISSVSYAPGVPEPASWALMILGLGGVGAALRRRRETWITAKA